jgi:NAD(P)-dependent dehydrogenase (short-subunit alcohol dehydrogenase family)
VTISFAGRVAIITGAGSGLGRSHARGLAALGAKVVVADLGVTADGRIEVSPQSLAVAEQIRAAGGEAVAEATDVTDFGQISEMVARTVDRWGRVDVLVNNAGIVRDKTFSKIALDDFELVLRVHVNGTVNCTKAVWPLMRDQSYGRIVFTSSSSGLYGNFGQSNYGAAKTAMVGLMNVLHLEGEKHGIRVNTLVPIASTGMTEGLLTAEQVSVFKAEAVTPAVLYLASEQAPSRVILGAGGGGYAVTHVVDSAGIYIPPTQRTPDEIARRFAEIADIATATPLPSGGAHGEKFLNLARNASLAEPAAYGNQRTPSDR